VPSTVCCKCGRTHLRTLVMLPSFPSELMLRRSTDKGEPLCCQYLSCCCVRTCTQNKQSLGTRPCGNRLVVSIAMDGDKLPETSALWMPHCSREDGPCSWESVFSHRD
jgi:hypothetical protein